MGVNRFMTPAELPKVSFFQLPYEQMKEGIMSAQMQQDAAREGISQIGDISFNYLTNPKVDPELAKNIYGELDSKTQAVLSKQGNGDLRGLRGEIYNLGKEVGRWYKPDGKIGRLQSNYLQYMDWLKRQNENKDLDKGYVSHAAKTFIDKYDADGGAQAGSIYTEDLEKSPNVPKFFNDNKDLLKAKLTQYAYANPANRRFIAEGTDATTLLTPDEIKRVMSGLLEDDPEYSKFMSQANRIGYYKDEQIPLLNPIEKEYVDPKTGKVEKQIDTEVNEKNPYASSLYAVMEGLQRNDYVQTRSLKNDSGWLDLAKWNKEQTKDLKPMFKTTVGQPVSISTNPLKYLQSFENATDVKIGDYIIEGAKDANGKVIKSEDIKSAYMKSINPDGTFDNIKFKDLLKENYNPVLDPTAPAGVSVVQMSKLFKKDYTNVLPKIKDYITKNSTIVDNSVIEFTAADPKENAFLDATTEQVKALQGGSYEVVSSMSKDLKIDRIQGNNSLIAGLVGQKVNDYTVTDVKVGAVNSEGEYTLSLIGKKEGEVESMVIPNSYTVIKPVEEIRQAMQADMQTHLQNDYAFNMQNGLFGSAANSRKGFEAVATQSYKKAAIDIYMTVKNNKIGTTTNVTKSLPGVKDKVEIKVDYQRTAEGYPLKNTKTGQHLKGFRILINGEDQGMTLRNENEIKTALYQLSNQ